VADTDMSSSVAIPTYSRADMGGPPVRSVLDQTYQDFETDEKRKCRTGRVKKE
jgi:hypothetical protein